jgi:hypothetical protein
MEVAVSSFILANAWLSFFGGVTVASVAVVNVAERTPRNTGLFFHFIAAMIQSRQRQAQRVIDRYRANDGYCAGSGSPQPDQTGASCPTAGFSGSERRTSDLVVAANGHGEQPHCPSRSNKLQSFAVASKIDSFVSADDGDCLVQVGKIR